MLVVKGYGQVQGVDFNDVFHMLLNNVPFMFCLLLVAMHGLELEWLDVKTSFLHGELEEQIYMQQAKGFQIEGEKGPCLLVEEVSIQP